MIFDTIISTLTQIFLFSFIPIIFWFFLGRKQTGLFSWLGIKKIKIANKQSFIFFCLLAFLTLLISGTTLLFFIKDKTILANYKFINHGVSGIISIFIYSIFQTSLAEEILFRGFFNKQISKIWGANIGNFIQALLFALVHGLLIINLISLPWTFLICTFTVTAGWIMGYIDENLADGSIIPSWCIHCIMNLVSSFVIMLLI